MAQGGSLTALSNELADAIAPAAASVVQVQGNRRPCTGVVFAPDAVLTMAHALGREEGLRVRTDDGRTLDAELGGWDPATGLAVLRVPAGAAPLTPSAAAARVGHLAIALARSWSNSLTASAGIVAVIGGPLPTGRRRAIDQVIRTTAPMHDGFAGGAVIDTEGRALGIATAREIRGFGVVIPAEIAWRAGAAILEHGRMKRGYLGVAVQPVRLGERQRSAGAGAERGVVVLSVTAGSPAESAGLLVGDVITAFNARPVESSHDLLDLLAGAGAGQQVALHVIRGADAKDLTATLAERPAA
jgi:serine protease Do